MSRLAKLSLGIAITLVLVGGALLGYNIVRAQEPDPTPVPPFGGSRGWGGQHGPGMMWQFDGEDSVPFAGPHHGMMWGLGPEAMHEALAGALGMSVEDFEQQMTEEGKTAWQIAQDQGLSEEDFTALMNDLHTDAIQQAVEDGTLTQEEADWMLEHMSEGFGPGMMWQFDGQDGAFSGPHHGMMGVYGGFGLMHDALADALGMSVEDFEQQMTEEGKTPWQIAEEQGLSEEDFAALLDDLRVDAIQQAVEDGIITQEQADWMLEHMGQGFGPGMMWRFENQDGTFYGPRHGMMGGGMMGGQRGWYSLDTDA